MIVYSIFCSKLHKNFFGSSEKSFTKLSSLVIKTLSLIFMTRVFMKKIQYWFNPQFKSYLLIFSAKSVIMVLIWDLICWRILWETVRYFECKDKIQQNTPIILYENGCIFAKVRDNVSFKSPKHLSITSMEINTDDW